MIHITSVKDVPKGPHWVIVHNTSVHIPGDERSRTHPGHGYPASTEYFMTYTAFDNEAEFIAELTRLYQSGAEALGLFVHGTYGKSILVTVRRD